VADDAPHHHRISIRGLSLQIHSQGSGPTLLYLHPGDGLSKSMPLMRCLANDFRVVAPSPPGFDGSDPPHAYRTVDDLSYVVLDVMDELQQRDVVLVGASFGAWLAAEVAIKSQERIAKLVLINPVGIKFGEADNQDIADIFYHSHRDVRRLLYSDGKPDEVDYGPIASDVVATMVRNRETLTWFAWSPLLNNPRLRARLHRIRVPTLLLRAANDRVVTERYSRSYADAIPGSRLDVIPDAGHYVHDEQPEELAKRITSFVKEQRERTDTVAPRRVEEPLP
jgi:pimeloyl-ACP methyl ester carboxylesterase